MSTPSQVTSGREFLIDGKESSSTQPVQFTNPHFDLTPEPVWKSTEAVLLRGGIPTRGANSVRILAVVPLPGTATEAAFGFQEKSFSVTGA